MRKIVSIVIVGLITQISFAQIGVIKGKVTKVWSNIPLAQATLYLQGTTIGAQTNDDGFYEIKNITPGTYNIECSVIGYKKKIEFEIVVDNATMANVDFALEPSSKQLKEIKIKGANKFYKLDESPLSVRNIGSNEIQRNPGSNRDISKVIQNLPGVASTVSYRNDLLVRGGGPSENRFYLDGIEIPNINHFASQGSTGGPVGLLNVDFIRDANFYSGAFPANRGNSMSSVLDLTNKNGRNDRWGGTLTTGYTASGLSLEGPAGSKATILLSARQSYLQVLFKQIGLPFLPTFTDFQFKVNYKPNRKNEFIFMGLNALDKFKYNEDALNNKDIARREYAAFVLGNLARLEQENNTLGINWKHFRANGYSTLVISRNALDNRSDKYENNETDNEQKLVFKYKSYESETKIRAENNGKWLGFKYNYGIGAENAYYTNATFNRISLPNGIDTISFKSKLSFNKYAAFGQLTKGFIGDLLTLSLGIRTDFNDYSATMANPFKQVSPRFSASYAMAENAHINFNTGIYYQLPSYTILGYRNANNDLVNKLNNAQYIQGSHVVLGADYFTKFNAKFSVEGFYKLYKNYPFSIQNQVSLANLGGDFGIIGNEPILSNNNGRAYGIEISYQQKLYKGLYGIFTYTYVKSEFENNKNEYVRASWDYGNIINATIGKKLKHNWEIGAKLRYQGGQPYTPYDLTRSLTISNWNITKQGLYDYSQLNTKQTQDVWGLDIRVDKKFAFKKWALIFYADVQNVTGTQSRQQDFLDVQKDALGNPLVNPNDPTQYQAKYIINQNGVRTPNVGIIVEF